MRIEFSQIYKRNEWKKCNEIKLFSLVCVCAVWCGVCVCVFSMAACLFECVLCVFVCGYLQICYYCWRWRFHHDSRYLLLLLLSLPRSYSCPLSRSLSLSSDLEMCKYYFVIYVWWFCRINFHFSPFSSCCMCKFTLQYFFICNHILHVPRVYKTHWNRFNFFCFGFLLLLLLSVVVYHCCLPYYFNE